jgi:hypothetical protein
MPLLLKQSSFGKKLLISLACELNSIRRRVARPGPLRKPTGVVELG